MDDLKNNPFRNRFLFATDSSNDCVYLDGNSLGRLPISTLQRIDQLLRHEWGEQLIRSWNLHWLELSKRIGEKIGNIIGASPGETRISDSTSTNLFKLAWALLQHRGTRTKILTDSANFPSDLYILSGIADQLGKQLHVQSLNFHANSPHSLCHNSVHEQLQNHLDESVALVSLSHVQYQSGYAFDLKAITEQCHRAGAPVLWDLSHSVGAIPIDLAAANADAAVGCTYKYLNGGPGAPAFLYLRSDLQSKLNNPIQGWFGAASPFEFQPLYQPANGLDRFLVGTPPILSTAAIEPGVDLILEAGLSWLHSRSIGLIDAFLQAYDNYLAPLGFGLLTPRDPKMRGSHLAITHPNGWQITQDLIQRYRVIPDFREPNIIRFGITPLTNQLSDIERAAEALQQSVLTSSYMEHSPLRHGVT
jgi:kynureninase